MKEKQNIFERFSVWIAPSLTYAAFIMLSTLSKEYKDTSDFIFVLFFGAILCLAIIKVVKRLFRSDKKQNVKQSEK